MKDIYILQLIGVFLTATGAIALMASAVLYGTPLTRHEKQRDGYRGGNVYRMPFNLETLASTLFLLTGMGILGWTKFEACAFLTRWLPGLPEAARIFLSCR
jgi:hypothetical protein